MKIPAYNKKTIKLKWSDEQKRTLIKESKNIPVDELAKLVGETQERTITMCSRLGCGYFTRQREEV